MTARKKTTRKPATHRNPVDEHAATELVMFIENTSDLSPDGPRGQGRDVLLNALRKWKKGTYDPELAVRLFQYLADAGAKRYSKEFGSTEFNPATRHEAARQLEASFRNSVENGEYEHVDTRVGLHSNEAPRAARMAEPGEPRVTAREHRGAVAASSRLSWRESGNGNAFTARGASGAKYYIQKKSRKWELTYDAPNGSPGGRRPLTFDNTSDAKRTAYSIERDVYAQRGSREMRHVSEGSDRPISMTYGTLPSPKEFEHDVRTRPDPDHPGKTYWPSGESFPMELVDSSEIELAEDYGLEPFETERKRTGRNSRALGFRIDTPEEMYSFLSHLAGEYQDGNEAAGDFASSIMTTLGYEWI